MAVIKYQDKRLGKQRFISASSYISQSITGRGQGRNKGRNLQAGTQEARRSAAYWLAPHSLLSLISYTFQYHLPMVGTIHIHH